MKDIPKAQFEEYDMVTILDDTDDWVVIKGYWINTTWWYSLRQFTKNSHRTAWVPEGLMIFKLSTWILSMNRTFDPMDGINIFYMPNPLFDE